MIFHATTLFFPGCFENLLMSIEFEVILKKAFYYSYVGIYAGNDVFNLTIKIN